MPPLPEFVEVQCAGCGKTLEVEPGLTEFACLDCRTQQALLPELMPPPRPRQSLPIPGQGPAAALVPMPVPARMPCGACGALLSVPTGLGCFACPLRGAELTVDGRRLRPYLASPAPTTVSVVAPPPAGITLTSPSLYRRLEQGQVERYHHPIRSIHREETFNSSRTDIRLTIHNMLAQKGPGTHSFHREKSHIESLDKTSAKYSARETRLSICPESTGVEKVLPEPPSWAQVLPPSYLVL
uniref:Uncharacterized protein n=1 Tax=Arundo donax TaxID=35708 RepID=A0A0A9CRK5_ARUDO